MRIKDDWLASLFTVGFIILALIVHYATDAGAWCEERETAAGCFREWVNAAGNMFTFLVAGLGVWIAVKALRATDRQANAIAIPGLDERIEICVKMLDIAEIYLRYSIKYRIDTKYILPRLGNVSVRALKQYMSDILYIINSHDKNANLLIKYSNSHTIDEDIKNIAIELLNLHNIDLIYNAKLQPIAIDMIEKGLYEASNHGKYIRMIQDALDGIEDFIGEANRREDKVSEILRSLNTLMEETKAERRRLTKLYQ